MAGMHEVPMYLLETRHRTGPKGRVWSDWSGLMENSDLVSLDDIVDFEETLQESPEEGVEYQARRHPSFGYEIRTLQQYK